MTRKYWQEMKPTHNVYGLYVIHYTRLCVCVYVCVCITNTSTKLMKRGIQISNYIIYDVINEWLMHTYIPKMVIYIYND